MWVNNFIKLLQDHGLQIKLRQNFVHVPQRINDRFLMDDITTKIPSKITLQRLNVCRMYLQVNFLSTITDMQDHQVSSSAIRGVRNLNQKVPSSGRYRNVPIKLYGNCEVAPSKKYIVETLIECSINTLEYRNDCRVQPHE